MTKTTSDPLAEERRENLNAIVGGAPVATFWRDHGLGELGISENYFRQLLSGNRNIGDRTARKIEGAIGKSLIKKVAALEVRDTAEPSEYRVKPSSAAGKLLRRLTDLDANERLNSALVRAINSMLDAAAGGLAPQISNPAYELVNNSAAEHDLGLTDDPELTDLGAHLKNALDALQQFRKRKAPPASIEPNVQKIS